MFRLHGGEWVAREIVKDVQRATPPRRRATS
jgi:hypothetical protein